MITNTHLRPATILLVALFYCSNALGQAQPNTFPAAGNTGIGTTTPSASLQINSGLVGDRQGCVNNATSLKIVNDQAFYSTLNCPNLSTNDLLSIQTRLINANGTTQTPNSVFTVAANGAVNAANAIGIRVASSYPLDVQGSTRLSGNVGINTVPSSFVLDVLGTTRLNGDVTVPNLTSSANSMVIATSTGLLRRESIPTMVLNGGNINLSNGGSISSSVSLSGYATTASLAGYATTNSLAGYATNIQITGTTLYLKNGGTTLNQITLPSGADNLGNHTATKDLNMSDRDVVNIGRLKDRWYNNIIKMDDAFWGVMIPNAKLAVATSPSSFTSPNQYEIVVQGDGVISGSWSTGSDARIKENIMPINNSDAARLLSTNTYKYTLKKELQSVGDKGREHYGVLAQELKENIPNLVHGSQDGMMAVNYTEMIPLLLEIVKDQQKKIDELYTLVGTAAKSKATAVGTTERIDSWSMKASPNPASQFIDVSVNAPKQMEVNIDVISYDGKVIQTLKGSCNSGETVIKIPVGQIASGVYMLRVSDGHIVRVERVSIQQ